MIRNKKGILKKELLFKCSLFLIIFSFLFYSFFNIYCFLFYSFFFISSFLYLAFFLIFTDIINDSKVHKH